MPEFLTKKIIPPPVDTASIRIGEFLSMLEVISPELLDDTLASARDLNVPVGRATVLRGLITNDELSNLIQLHCLVRNDTITIEEARDAFFMARRKSWPIRESLVALGCMVEDGSTVRIGELLIESERISDQDLDMSLALQTLCGMPLGRILAIDACVPEQVVNEALNLQSEIRQRKKSYRDAVSSLRKVKVQKEDLQARQRLLLNRLGAEDGFIDLPELLVAGKVIEEQALMPARHQAVAKGIPLSDVLRSQETIDLELLSAACALVGLVKDGYVSVQESIGILRALKPSDDTLDELPLVSGNTPKTLTLYQFLVMSGFLTPEGIRKLIRTLSSDLKLFEAVTGIDPDSFRDKKYMKTAIIKSIVDSRNLEKTLAACGANVAVVSYARDLLSLLSLGVISVDQAILSFARMRYDSGERSVMGPTP